MRSAGSRSRWLRAGLVLIVLGTAAAPWPTIPAAGGPESESDSGAPRVGLMINELELNPPGSDGARGAEEWIELFNPTGDDVDVGGWTFSTTGGYDTVTVRLAELTAARRGEVLPESDRVVRAGGYLVLYLEGRQWLDNFEESVSLRDADDREVDRTPLLTDGQDDDRTWQRVPDGQDTDTNVDWRFEGRTRGEANR